jgi:hypothetical protein
MALSKAEINALRDVCRQLPPGPDYRCNDYVENLLITALDFQQRVEVVNAAMDNFREKHGGTDIDGLDRILGTFPDTQEGNRALSQSLWSYNLWTRAKFVRLLAQRFGEMGITDQQTLVSWLRQVDFNTQVKGKFKVLRHGIGITILNWLALRSGIATIKPDVHVLRFVATAIGRKASPEETIAALTQIAADLGIEPFRLDSAIWHHQRDSESKPAEPTDFTYCLDCFLDLDRAEGTEPDDLAGSDDVNELVQRAELLVEEGRFKRLDLYRWNANSDEWDKIRSWPQAHPR